MFAPLILAGLGHFQKLPLGANTRRWHVSAAVETGDNPIVVCPHCNKSFPLTEALTHEAREQLLAQEREQLDAQREEMRLFVTQEQERLEAQREQIREEVRQEVREEIGVELSDLQARAEEEKRRVSEAQEKELELRKANRELRQRLDEQELAQERERDQLDAQLREEYEQTNAVRLKEKEDHIERLNAQITELKRKADSPFRLAEGIPNQEVFAESLRHLFPYDDIRVIPRGQAGADVIHGVHSSSGQRCGSLFWECKRAGTWQAEWLDKLAKDQAGAEGDVGVIVSEVLPAGMKGCGQIGPIWVCNYATAPALAMALRSGLVEVASYRTANALRQDAAGRVFDYISTGGFAPRVLELCRGIGHMQEELHKEKQAMTRLWGQRGKELERCVNSIARLVGELLGVGAEIAPEVRSETALPAETPIGALAGPEPSSAEGSSRICRDCGQPFPHDPHRGRPPLVCPECRGEDNRRSA